MGGLLKGPITPILAKGSSRKFWGEKNPEKRETNFCVFSLILAEKNISITIEGQERYCRQRKTVI